MIGIKFIQNKSAGYKGDFNDSKQFLLFPLSTLIHYFDFSHFSTIICFLFMDP